MRMRKDNKKARMLYALFVTEGMEKQRRVFLTLGSFEKPK